MHGAESAESWIAEARRRIALRSTEKPATKAGQIRALWPQINAALEGGQSMKSIRKWLEEDAGIKLSITSLTSYISRIRRRQARRAPAVAGLPRDGAQSPAIPPGPREEPPHDPLAQAMQALSKRRLDIRELHGDGDPQDKNLI